MPPPIGNTGLPNSSDYDGPFPGAAGINPNSDGTVVSGVRIYDQNRCYKDRDGGNDPWKAQNPYKLKPEIDSPYGSIGSPPIQVYPNQAAADADAKFYLFHPRPDSNGNEKNLKEMLDYFKSHGSQAGEDEMNCIGGKIREKLQEWGIGQEQGVNGLIYNLENVRTNELTSGQKDEILGCIAECIEPKPEAGEEGVLICPDGGSSGGGDD